MVLGTKSEYNRKSLLQLREFNLGSNNNSIGDRPSSVGVGISFNKITTINEASHQ